MAAAAKWDEYYASCDLQKQLPPWDSGRPCSQLQALVDEDERESGATVAAAAVAMKGGTALDGDAAAAAAAGSVRTALDLGCGSGASTCFLASRGWTATGVDICEKAIALARQRWEIEAGEPRVAAERGEGGGAGSSSSGVAVASSTTSATGATDASCTATTPPRFEQADFFKWCQQRFGGGGSGGAVRPPAVVGAASAAAPSSSAAAPPPPPPPPPPPTPAALQFDLVFDCQFFHALWHPNNGNGGIDSGEGAAHGRHLARHIARCVAPGGKLLLLTGNMDDRRDTGPTRLTAQQVLGCFLGPGTNLRLLRLERSVFDLSPAYAALEDGPPLAWCAVFEKE